MSLKVKKLVELKDKYSFEAPMLRAAFPAGKSGGIKAMKMLDIYKMLAPNPENIYLVRVNGESMINENIYDGDILIVDRKEKPSDGKVVISALNGEMTVKTFRNIEGQAYLFSANDKFLPIKIMPFWEFEIQGIVKHVIHPM